MIFPNFEESPAVSLIKSVDHRYVRTKQFLINLLDFNINGHLCDCIFQYKIPCQGLTLPSIEE